MREKRTEKKAKYSFTKRQSYTEAVFLNQNRLHRHTVLSSAAASHLSVETETLAASRSVASCQSHTHSWVMLSETPEEGILQATGWKKIKVPYFLFKRRQQTQSTRLLLACEYRVNHFAFKCLRRYECFLKNTQEYSEISCIATFTRTCVSMGMFWWLLTVAAALRTALLTVNESLMYVTSVISVTHFPPSV